MKIGMLVLLAALAGPGLASAQDAPHGPETPEQLAVRAEVTKLCAADMQTICGGQTGRAGRACLDQNPTKVTPACKAALDKLPKAPARPGAPTPKP
ncbi:hypothetical protein DJ021_03215 [Phenylobacterium hankyongense]|uniref:Phosphate starvation-inducible protein PsiF n=1 Tax=Phenylobacterium hankyongense TaxID=1813876 RepID=A0A328AV24_9CAUL|nr:hypothetical protein [Phenylobacterium hankyongense]RAK58880.1 hypothetical protein DJ021_03215 [Phenylobacterium hankyongense]